MFKLTDNCNDFDFQHINNGLTLSDLPLHMLNNILHRFSDGWDIITLGQVTPTLYMLSEDRQLWKKLCQYHFAEKQVRKSFVVHILLFSGVLELCFCVKNQRKKWRKKKETNLLAVPEGSMNNH